MSSTTLQNFPGQLEDAIAEAMGPILAFADLLTAAHVSGHGADSQDVGFVVRTLAQSADKRLEAIRDSAYALIGDTAHPAAESDYAKTLEAGIEAAMDAGTLRQTKPSVRPDRLESAAMALDGAADRLQFIYDTLYEPASPSLSKEGMSGLLEILNDTMMRARDAADAAWAEVGEDSRDLARALRVFVGRE